MSGLHLIFKLASVAFLSYKVYYIEFELSLIRGKTSVSDGRILVTEATPPSSLIPNGEELRSERNRRADQEKVESSSAAKLKEVCVQMSLDDLQAV